MEVNVYCVKISIPPYLIPILWDPMLMKVPSPCVRKGTIGSNYFVVRKKRDIFPLKVPGEKSYLAVIMRIPPPGGVKQDYSPFWKLWRTGANPQP